MNIMNGVARVNLNVEKPALTGSGGRESLAPASAGRPARMNRWWLALAIVGTLLNSSGAFAYTTNMVEKVADLTFYLDENQAGHGGTAPKNSFTQVGTQIWFTTSGGGYYGAGTVSLFDLPTHQVEEVASLNDTTGGYPYGSLLVLGNEGYFTTSTDGGSNRGTIAQIDLPSGNVTPLFTFPNNGQPTGEIPRASLTQIGNALWTITELGGISNRGVVVNYNLTNGVTTVVTNLDGPHLGAEAFSGFTAVSSNAWYFDTFAGGNTFKTTDYLTNVQLDGSIAIITNSMPIGVGTLELLTFDSLGNPNVANVLSLPGGYDEFPALPPILVGTNSLYFTSVGLNAQPGAILRYDISTGLLTNLFSFSTNALPSTLYGTRPGYSGLTEWQGELYFINWFGGIYSTGPNTGGGTVAKFNIASNTVIKLADLGNTSDPTDDLGSPSGFYGTGTIVQETNRFYVYYPLTSGGANNIGTIIRVLLPPQPIQLVGLGVTNATNVNISWSGGYPPFDVLTNGDLSLAVTNWPVAITNITSTINTTNWSATLPLPVGSTFFRIRGQAQ
jgi:hypothetical protein